MRLGADPEVFMTNIDGQLVSVIGKIPGTKWNPLQIQDLPIGFTLQQDNVALEFGIPPASTVEEYKQYLNLVKQKGLEYLPHLKYTQDSCAIFQNLKCRIHKHINLDVNQTIMHGTGKKNEKPDPPHPFMRSAGGHIHVETKLPKKPVVQALDVFIGIPSTLMDKGEDRKMLYGKAGACRYKPYGVEYRTPSNFWIFEDRLIEWVWENTERALHSVKKGKRWLDQADVIQSCINNNDKKLAEKLVKKHQLSVCY